MCSTDENKTQDSRVRTAYGMKKKYIFEEADITGGLVIIRDKGGDDGMSSITLAYRVCWQGSLKEKAALTSLADGSVTEFVPLEKLVKQINRDGYRPVTINELMKMTIYAADQHTLDGTWDGFPPQPKPRRA